MLPFSLVVDERETSCFGPNTIGLERKGFSPSGSKRCKERSSYWDGSKMNTTQALEEMRKKLADSADVKELVEFIETAKRGIVK